MSNSQLFNAPLPATDAATEASEVAIRLATMKKEKRCSPVGYTVLPAGVTYRVRVNKAWMTYGDSQGAPFIVVLPSGQEFYFDDVEMPNGCHMVWKIVEGKRPGFCGGPEVQRAAWVETEGPLYVR